MLWVWGVRWDGDAITNHFPIELRLDRGEALKIQTYLHAGVIGRLGYVTEVEFRGEFHIAEAVLTGDAGVTTDR